MFCLAKDLSNKTTYCEWLQRVSGGKYTAKLLGGGFRALTGLSFSSRLTSAHGQYRSLDRWLSAEERSENREHTEQTQTYQDWPTTTHNFLCERHASTQHKDRDNKNKDQYCRND